MLAGDLDRCFEFPCQDVRHRGYAHPVLPARRENVRVMMISGAPDSADSPSAYDSALSRVHTLQVFRDAGYDVTTMDDIDALGVYVTTAVRCPKLGYGLKPETIINCSFLLEAELAMLPNVRSILLMGDTAIKAINQIAIRRHGSPAIPTGSSHKVKGHEYLLDDIALFPSYPQDASGLSAEGDRHEVIVVDIRNAIVVADDLTAGSHQTGPIPERPRSPAPPRRGPRERSVESSSA